MFQFSFHFPNFLIDDLIDILNSLPRYLQLSMIFISFLNDITVTAWTVTS